MIAAPCLIVKGTIAPRFETFLAKCRAVASVHIIDAESLRTRVGARRAELLKPYDFFICDNAEYESTERLISNLLKTRQLVRTKLRGEKGCRNVLESLARTAVKQHGQTWCAHHTHTTSHTPAPPTLHCVAIATSLHHSTTPPFYHSAARIT